MLRGWRAGGNVFKDAASAACKTDPQPVLPGAAGGWGCALTGLPAATRSFLAGRAPPAGQLRRWLRAWPHSAHCAHAPPVPHPANTPRRHWSSDSQPAHAARPPACPSTRPAPPEKRRRWRRRRAAAAAASLGGGGALAAVAAADFDGVRARALAESAPRTFAAAQWCRHASAAYKRCQAAHAVRGPSLHSVPGMGCIL